MNINEFALLLQSRLEEHGAKVNVPEWSDTYMGGRERILIFSKSGDDVTALLPLQMLFGLFKFVGNTNDELFESLGLQIQASGFFNLLFKREVMLQHKNTCWLLKLVKSEKAEKGHRWSFEATEM